MHRYRTSAQRHHRDADELEIDVCARSRQDTEDAFSTTLLEGFMSEGTGGLIIFTIITLGSALVWHWLIAHYVSAVIGATITAVMTFQVAAYFYVGYLDPFFLVALVTSAIVAAVIALLVGLPFRERRRPHVSNAKAL
jgi:hypothetical protein